jgi:hypothetical protein
MPAECEISVNGQPCGVLAIGRCSVDGLAFCGTHQAKKYGPGRIVDVSYVDTCTSCYAQVIAKEEEMPHRKRQRALQGADMYLHATAMEDLIAAGVPPVRIRLKVVNRPRVTESRRLFGGVKRTVSKQEVDIWGKGWVVGSCSWHYRNYGMYGSESDVESRFLTALIDAESVDDTERLVMGYSTSKYILAAVVKFSEGDYHVCHMEREPGCRVESSYEVAEAIRRLTGN